ncbi:MAG: dihydroneopterin aldolase [Actinomycetota bacterium]|nr:dihydroneopterin aldolase [Actinomycetota bacterium]
MRSRVISIRGIIASGRHGAKPGERDEAQEFLIDLEVEVDVGSDDLDATADYRALADGARKTVEATSFVLLETLAQAVADEVAQQAHVRSLRVTVHKPSAAASIEAEDVAATATGGGSPQGL